MVEVANPAGRLVTFRVRTPVDDNNAGHAAGELRRLVEGIAGSVIVCSDLTEARTFAPETAERFVRVMKADNPKLERSALLIGNNSATFAMQLERMVREAHSPARQTFRDARLLVEWLQPLLNPPESQALLAFLASM